MSNSRRGISDAIGVCKPHLHAINRTAINILLKYCICNFCLFFIKDHFLIFDSITERNITASNFTAFPFPFEHKLDALAGAVRFILSD